MKKYLKLFVGAFLFGAVLCAGRAFAQDPMEVGPGIYSLLFENERVRVMSITFKPGDKIAMHSHPDHVTSLITGGTLKLSYPDGSSKELAGKAGEAFWIPAESHAAENVGTTEVIGIVVELKESAPVQAEQ